jgi:fucose 4-O-acetylase-like acetyltransferase
MHPASLPRYHALDALRAAMMLLGLVLHSAASYTRRPLGEAWPIHDAHTSVLFDLLAVFIHLFRMPAFFLIAGFFAALLYVRDGAAGLARNRARRVLLPLVLFWIVVPLAGLGFVYSLPRTGGAPVPMGDGVVPVWRLPIFGHLWFLYFLVLFYPAALAIAATASLVGTTINTAVDRAFRAVMTRWWGPAILGLVTTATILPMQIPGIETHASLAVPPRVLVAYFVFFGAGWLLFRNRDLVTTLGAQWRAPLVLGVLGALAYLFVAVAQTGFNDARTWHLTATAIAGPAIWFLVIGIVGGCVRFLESPRPFVRYLSDASYWMYLTHLVPATWLPGTIGPLALPGVVKFTIVFSLTSALSVLTYHYLVRSTAIGELLNGRRYLRALREPLAV